MKRLLFVLITIFTFSTIIYASFPISEDTTEIVNQNNQPIEYPDPNDGTNMVVLCALGFIGLAGMHRFAKGDVVGGVLMLITLGGCGLWTLIDCITLANEASKTSL